MVLVYLKGYLLNPEGVKMNSKKVESVLDPMHADKQRHVNNHVTG
jgi:hypothetical protein